MAETPIHDWKDAAYYDELKKETSLTRWAWEFLRRNPDYQAEYKQFSEFPDVGEDWNGIKNGKWKGSIWQGARFYVDAFHHTNPPAYFGESLEEYDIRCPEGVILPFVEHLILNYHIGMPPPDPAKDIEEQAINFNDYDGESPFHSKFAPWEIDIFPPYEMHFSNLIANDYISQMREYCSGQGIMILAFDVNQPIDKQIDTAKQWLLDRKDEVKEYKEPLLQTDSGTVRRPNVKLNKFPIYIRILDAYAIGVGPSEIGRVIYNEKNTDTNNVVSKVIKNFAAAKRWRDEDYWKIAV